MFVREFYILDGLFSGAFGLAGGIFSAQSQESINSENIAFQKLVNAQNQRNFDRSFDYTVQQNLLQQQREDTSHQREVQDLIAAGLSPLANKSGSTTGSMMSTPSAPNLVAPQADSTGFLQAGSAISHLGDLAKDFYSIESDDKRAKAKNDTDIMISSANIAADLQKTRELISSNESIAESDRKNSYQISLDKIENDLKLLNLSNKFENERQARAMSHEVKIKLMDQGIYNFDEYTDYDEYLAAKAAYDEDVLSVMDSHMSKLRKSLESSNSSWSADLGAGKLGSIGGSKSDGSTLSVDETEQYHEYMSYYKMHRRYPIYVGLKK